MKTLVVGASGATGRLLVEQLLNSGEHVKIIVRSTDNMPETVTKHENVTVTIADVFDLTDSDIDKHIKGCHAVASCLGHTLSLKGMYGHPRKLVTNTIQRLCIAIKKSRPEMPVKVVLMNTTGNRNRDLSEKITLGHALVIWLLRLLLPPHVDNEKAADYLRTEIGQNNNEIEWSAVRPDTLINEANVTEYEAYLSPTRSAIFDVGTTSRINVGNFMATLITHPETWEKWKGKMPVVYNATKQI